MNKTTIAVAAGLLSAFGSASQAQYPLTYTLGYSSFTGCNVGPAMLTLPGGGVYYVPGTGPGPGGIGVGVCWFGTTTGSGYVGVPTGWLGIGYTPPPPTYSDDDDDYSNANNDEEAPPNIQLLSTEGGDHHDGEHHEDGDHHDGDHHDGDYGDHHDGDHNGGGPGVSTTATTTTPEPASLVLVGSGLAGLAGLGWRRRNR